MSLANISIRRPIFITCVVIVMLALGVVSIGKLGIDLFPDVTFPIVTVTIPYPGAGPSEIETLVTKPLEDEISTISGIKRMTSKSLEGTSQVMVQFFLEVDIKYAEQQIRDKVTAARPKLPLDIKEPVIRRIDPSDQPVVTFALSSKLPPAKAFDLADDVVRPRIEQVNQVGLVEISGGRKREIRVALDRRRLKARELSVTGVAQMVGASGENVPSGKVNEGARETVFRSLGQFNTLEDVRKVVVSFFGNEVPVTVEDVGRVEDSLEDERSQAFYNGQPALFINIYRQSGSNTIAVVEAVKKQVERINADLSREDGSPQLEVVRDGSIWIHNNVDDVKETIAIGILLTIIVVFFFLGNGRSTIITGLALPNSLIGAFVLMAAAGFTINIVTLLALSLSVGLLIDDAIVVRENIFRRMEQGENALTAAIEGTAEVRMAVIATTLVVIAVFGPVAFMKGFMGQFFRQFGLTVCFAMAISLFDALTLAPMLSAYFAGNPHAVPKSSWWRRILRAPLDAFETFQQWLEDRYEHVLRFSVRRPLIVLGGSFLIFAASCASLTKVPKTFFPPQDSGEFSVDMDLPPGASLSEMSKVARQADEILRKNPEVQLAALTVGGRNGEANQASFYVHLVPSKQRKVNTIQFKERLRSQLVALSQANPKVKDYDPSGGGARPFNLNLIGNDQKQLEEYATQILEKMHKHPGLKDIDTSYRPGKPEFQVKVTPVVAQQFGITQKGYGGELRAQVEGLLVAKFREQAREYNVRVRLQDDQRNLRDQYEQIYVPNVNNSLVRLSSLTKPVEATGPANIDRQDRGRYIQLSADIAPGAGLGDIMGDVNRMLKDEIKLPNGVKAMYVGDSENFEEFGSSMLLAMGASVLFIFLVLASLYESFITPFTIMLALPLAICGAFFALFVTGESVNLFSIIGVILLLGVASKNSILLVDYANQLIEQGMERSAALIKAGRTRLRPILMTSMALIAGTLPVAMGLNEASKQRTSMGIAIIGGLISSTVLTLLVVPAAFSYIDRFRIWVNGLFRKISGQTDLTAVAKNGAAPAHQPKQYDQAL